MRVAATARQCICPEGAGRGRCPSLGSGSSAHPMRSQAAELGLHHADAFGEPRTSERLIIRFTPLILKPADTSGKSLQSALHIRGVQSVGSLLF